MYLIFYIGFARLQSGKINLYKARVIGALL